MHTEFTGEKKICHCQEDLLNLIDDQDVFNILSEENMQGFNELMKYELIMVKDDKVYLTPLGKEAQVLGVKNVIARIGVKNVAGQFPFITFIKKRKIFLIWSVLLLFLALLFLVFKYIWQ